MEHARAVMFGALKHMPGADGAGTQRFDRVGLVVDGRCRAGEVIDLVEARQA